MSVRTAQGHRLRPMEPAASCWVSMPCGNSIPCTVRMLHGIEFPHGIDTQQLAAGSIGRNLCPCAVRTDIVNSVDQKPVLLRALADNRKGVAVVAIVSGV